MPIATLYGRTAGDVVSVGLSMTLGEILCLRQKVAQSMLSDCIGPGDHEYVAIYGIRTIISIPNIWYGHDSVGRVNRGRCRSVDDECHIRGQD